VFGVNLVTGSDHLLTQPTKGLTEGGYLGGEVQVDVPRSAKPFRMSGLSNRHRKTTTGIALTLTSFPSRLKSSTWKN